MAEVFGAVTGGLGLVSLAVQLTEYAVKVNGFAERMKNVQGTLHDFSHDLETIALTLRELDVHQQCERNDALLLTRCAETCRQKANKIKVLVDKIERYIVKFSVFGKAYAAMKQSEITELMDQLEQAKSSIFIALELYFR